MKRTYIYIILIFFLVTSCYQKSNRFQITDFSKVFKDTLIPTKNGTYASSILKINGQTNDTIKIEFNGIRHKYIGEINDEINMDYYGGEGHNVEFVFDPYKATKGSLEIEYGLY